MDDYQRCKYSKPALGMTWLWLIACELLSQHAENGCLPQIAWAGTSEKNWREHGRKITLRLNETHCPRPEWRRSAAIQLATGATNLEDGFDRA